VGDQRREGHRHSCASIKQSRSADPCYESALGRSPALSPCTELLGDKVPLCVVRIAVNSASTVLDECERHLSRHS